MKTVVPIAADGRLTLPADLRAELGLSGGGDVELELADGAVVVRPVDRLTPAEEAHIRRGLEDIRAGRVCVMSVEELEHLIEQA